MGVCSVCDHHARERNGFGCFGGTMTLKGLLKKLRAPVAYAIFVGAGMAFLSMAQLMTQATSYPSAGDIVYNVLRGSRLQEYAGPGQPFSIPMLWICWFSLLLLGCAVLFARRGDDRERVIVLSLGSRRGYWRMQCGLALLFLVACIATLLLASAFFAFITGGTCNLTMLTPEATSLFLKEGPVIWGPVGLICCLGLQLAALPPTMLVGGFLSRLFGIPVGCSVVLGYGAVSIFSGVAAMIPNALMAHRLFAYTNDGLAAAGFLIGWFVVSTVCAVLYRRLFACDFW